MVNLILAVDEADKELGNFFDSCATKIKESFALNAIITELNSNLIQNDIIINQQISEFTKRFIFIGLTHGSDKELTGSRNIPYITTKKNNSLFQGTLFYCFACRVGNILGKEIIKQGGKCFVGHNQEIYANNIGIWKNLFSQPILYFWNKFFTGETILSCIRAKKEEYTRIIDDIYKTDIFHAVYLMSNRDSLVIYGDENCSINDFN
jgi:hypothetical protein